MLKTLNIFIPHCSGLLTDHKPHGDGLVAHGFISHLAERGHRLFVAAEDVDLARKLPSNVRIYPIVPRTQRRGLKRLDYMLQVRTLFRNLRHEVQLDLVHQLNPVYTGISLALWGSELPLVLGPYVADWPNDPHAMAASTPWLRGTSRKLKNLLAYLQQRSADALLLTTDAASQRVIGSNKTNVRSFIVPHGIDSNLFSPGNPQTSAAERSDDPVILFYANVSARKGIVELLTAFEHVASSFPRAQLWIAGTGEELPTVRAKAAGLEAQDRVSFLGRKTRAEAVDLFRKASIYCLPSHGEPFGMTVAEAMSCGRPVVVTDAGGVKCLVDDQGGIRVPVRDPQALGAALCELLADPGRRASMGAYNRAKVLNTMTWERVVDQLEEVYSQTLMSHAKHKPNAEILSPSSLEDYS